MAAASPSQQKKSQLNSASFMHVTLACLPEQLRYQMYQSSNDLPHLMHYNSWFDNCLGCIHLLMLCFCAGLSNHNVHLHPHRQWSAAADVHNSPGVSCWLAAMCHVSPTALLTCAPMDVSLKSPLLHSSADQWCCPLPLQYWRLLSIDDRTEGCCIGDIKDQKMQVLLNEQDAH